MLDLVPVAQFPCGDRVRARRWADEDAVLACQLPHLPHGVCGLDRHDFIEKSLMT